METFRGEMARIQELELERERERYAPLLPRMAYVAHIEGTQEREGEVYTTMEYLDPPLLVHPPRHSPLSHDLCAVVAVSTGY